MSAPSPDSRDPQVEAVCVVMHDAYEAAAVGAGWETQAASRKPWAGVPEANKATMRAAVGAVLDRWLVLDPNDDALVERIAETLRNCPPFNTGSEDWAVRDARAVLAALANPS